MSARMTKGCKKSYS